MATDQTRVPTPSCQKLGCQAYSLLPEIERLREALELIARGVWTAPNSVETIVFTARRALSSESPS